MIQFYSQLITFYSRYQVKNTYSNPVPADATAIIPPAPISTSTSTSVTTPISGSASSIPTTKINTAVIMSSTLAGIFGGIVLLVGSLFIIKKYKNKQKYNKSIMSKPESNDLSQRERPLPTISIETNDDHNKNILEIPESNDLSQQERPLPTISEEVMISNHEHDQNILEIPGSDDLSQRERQLPSISKEMIFKS